MAPNANANANANANGTGVSGAAPWAPAVLAHSTVDGLGVLDLLTYVSLLVDGYGLRRDCSSIGGAHTMELPRSGGRARKTSRIFL